MSGRRWPSIGEPGRRSLSAALLAAPLFLAGALLPRESTGQAFEPEKRFATPGQPFGVAIGDLNGDQRADLVVAMPGSRTVAVLLGNGDGTFGTATSFPVAGQDFSVAIGEFNGDGALDVVAPNHTTHTVSALLGNGSGGLGPKTDFDVGDGPNSVAVGDLNGDGRADLAVANELSNTITTLLGDGAGGFGSRHDLTTGATPSTVAIGLLNADNRPDLAVTNLASNTVSVFLGNGDGSFGPKTDFAAGTHPLSLAIGDLDADGKLDLVASNPDDAGVAALLGNGNGQFGPVISSGAGTSPRGIGGADLDGDGKLDLIVANYSVNRLSLLHGEGDGRLTRPIGYIVVGNGPQGVAIGDLTGDGRLDVVAACQLSSAVSVLIQLKTPTTTSLASSPNPSNYGEPVDLTATVSPAAATGTVVFKDGPVNLGVASLSGGMATMTISTLGAGSHSLTAVYLGDGNYATSTSVVITHVVIPTPTSTSLGSAPAPSTFGQPVQLTATVTPSEASGTVSFFDGPFLFGTANLSGGTATFTTSTLTTGSHSLQARYPGVGNFGASETQIVVHEVLSASTVTTITSSSNPSLDHLPVTFTVSVAPVPPGAGTPTGAVQFKLDGADFGAPVPVAGGTATRTATLAVGAHEVQAVYGGNANFATSASPILAQAVEASDPVIVAVRDVPNDQGGRVFLTWRCRLDSPGNRLVTGYRVWRRAPSPTLAPAARAEDETFWEAIAALPPEQLVSYGFTAPTTQDSIEGSNPYTAFLVDALTADPFVFFRSAPDSGYSVDNLSPPIPAPFEAVYGPESTALRWGASPAPDLAEFRLYRGASPDFVPRPDNLIAATRDTGYVDPGRGSFVYKLAAVDRHGNPSPYALATSDGPTATAERLVFGLEGVRPNPAVGGDLVVYLSLASAAPARLELLDVGGRRIAQREVGSLGPGRHAVSLREAGAIPPGLYLIRLTQGGERRVVRAAVID